MARKANGALLDRDAILGADDLKTERVEVPEWGGAVLVGTMSGTARDLWEQYMFAGDRDEVRQYVRGSLCAHTIVDADGRRLFDESEIADLSRKSSAALDRVYEVAVRLNRISAADVEELEKN